LRQDKPLALATSLAKQQVAKGLSLWGGGDEDERSGWVKANEAAV